MSAIIMDGKKVAAELRQVYRKEIEAAGIHAHLAVIVVGDDPASAVYVRNKEKACAECGIKTTTYKYDAISEKDLKELLVELSIDDDVTGILIQLPLPDYLDQRTILDSVPACKDVDAFSFYNEAEMYIDTSNAKMPCTPYGIIALLIHYGIGVSGKHVVIVGRSKIVGKPLAMIMLEMDATVTVCHSKTANLSAHTKMADILISAAGKPNLITADMVKPGAVVVDVGINRVDGKLCGDVDFEHVKEVADYITPVPGGVGPMTIAGLINNTGYAAFQQSRRRNNAEKSKLST